MDARVVAGTDQKTLSQERSARGQGVPIRNRFEHGGNLDVGGLQIAVNNSFPVCGLDSLANLAGNAHCAVERYWRFLKNVQ
jgi:hypothetical protein